MSGGVIGKVGKTKFILGVIFLLILFIFLFAYIKSEVPVENSDKKDLIFIGDVQLLPDEVNFPTSEITSTQELESFILSDDAICLLKNLEDEEIDIYGIKINGKNDSYYLEGIAIKFKNKVQVFDIIWGGYSGMTEFSNYDFDQDNVNEIAMITISDRGTGIAVNNLYVFEWNTDTNEFTYESYETADWIKDLKSRLSYTVEADQLIIKLDKIEKIQVKELSAYEEKWGEHLTSVIFTTVGKFSFEQDKIYLDTKPWAVVGNHVVVEEILKDDFHFEVQYKNGFMIKEESSQ